MKPLPLAATALAAALFAACAASAQSAPDAARQAELDAAREDLHRAARRVAELSREMGRPENIVLERRLRQRPVLGVILEPDAGAGVRIAAVTPESAAAKAGLRSGDRITAFDGKALAGKDGEERLADARARLRDLDAKTPVAVTYLRDGRSASAKVTPGTGDELIMLHRAGELAALRGAAMAGVEPGGARMVRIAPGGVAPEIRREIIRERICDDGECSYPMLAEAFRWNGLNLASVDRQLGRYFGAERGVLVLSVPEGLGGLQPGDVLQKIDGKPVDTPREAMALTHAREPGAAVPVEYLRDRKRAATTITVPERRAFRLPLPPAPPAPPAPPTPPAPGSPAAPEAPPAPPAPPQPPQAFSLL